LPAAAPYLRVLFFADFFAVVFLAAVFLLAAFLVVVFFTDFLLAFLVAMSGFYPPCEHWRIIPRYVLPCEATTLMPLSACTR
jgi:hypothetical protein